MLQNLVIENYALIDKLSLDFERGFSVITGETGAGKSIMLGALALILGSRADTQVLRNKEKKCVVEGSFFIKDYKLDKLFEINELDYDDHTILRREITPSGKSRAFINDTPVNLNVLKSIGDRLVNIHSQHANISLSDSNFQLAVIDNFVGHDELIENYRKLFFDFKEKLRQLEILKEEEAKSKADQDYFQFQFDELEQANLNLNEQAELESEQEILSHAEEIKTGLYESMHQLGEGESNLIDQLSEVCQKLHHLSEYHPQIRLLAERVDSNIIDLKDLNQEVTAIESGISLDPSRLEWVSERLNMIYHLQQKHRVNGIDGLILIKNDLDDKLNNISSLDTKIENLKNELNLLNKKLSSLAEKISKQRRLAIPQIEKAILAILHNLGMPDAQIKIKQDATDQLNKDGADKVIYLFNANKGGTLNEMVKIASGGELSRLMLSIKSLISGRKLLPTIVFDEIDLGISGEIASKMGEILSQMAAKMQVVAITHLPQIAGKGHIHYRVSKSSNNNSTSTLIENLSNAERIDEIAKMISGEFVTEVAIENAKVLLS